MNIFKDKKFGDILITRSGQKVAFLGEFTCHSLGMEDFDVYQCWIEDEEEPFYYYEDGTTCLLINNQTPTELENGTIELLDTDIV